MNEALDLKYLTLSIREELYAIPIASVLEVLECPRLTALPLAAPYMKGIISLRGKSVPVLDLRARFRLPPAEAGADRAVVVVELPAAEGAADAAAGAGGAVIGILAEAVHEVVELESGSLEKPPRFGTGIDAGFLSAIGKTEKGFILVLDVAAVLDEESHVEAAPGEAAPGEAMSRDYVARDYVAPVEA